MVRAKKRLLAALVFTGIIILNACEALDPSGPLAAPDDLAFAISPSEVTVAVGESFTLTPTLVKANGGAVNPKALNWESTDATRATVTRDGLVTAVAPGHPMIIASSGKVADTTSLRIVEEREIRPGVDISPDELSLHWLNATAALTASVRDDDGTLVAQPGLTWKSLNPGIVQTDNMGTITAKGVGLALIVATATCCDRADTAYARVHQVVDAVVLEDETLSLAEGSSKQLKPVALDRGGSVIQGATFEFKSSNESVARVSSDGVLSARSSGTTTVTAASEGESDGVSVTVTGGTLSGGGSAQRPNEPAGFVPWFVHDWQSFPPDRETCVVPASDKGYMIFCGVTAGVHHGKLIDDPNAPHGFGKSIRIHWPADHPTGHGLWNWAMRSTPHRTMPDVIDTSTPLQKWYISTWVYLEPMNAHGEWLMNWDQLRMFTGNRHIAAALPGGPRTLFGWTFKGGLKGDEPYWSDWATHGRHYRLWGYPEPDGSSFSIEEGGGPGIPVGEWVHMELLFDRTVKGEPLFSPDSNGIGPVRYKIWMNGELKLDDTREWYMAYPFMELFFNINQSGGVSSTHERWLRVSGTYVSGEVYQGKVY
jgi:uncharacterized protein YjdB